MTTVYIYRERERDLNSTKTTYALHLCRCPCGNVLKPKHEITKPKSIQNILFKQEYSTPHYLWTRTAIPSPSSNPELLHFFLEPLVRRSTAMMSANCTRTRTQLLTVERCYCQFDESRAAMRLRKACMDWWAIPSTVTIKGQNIYIQSCHSLYTIMSQLEPCHTFNFFSSFVTRVMRTTDGGGTFWGTMM